MKKNTVLFTEEFLKKCQRNDGFFLIGCHGKGRALATMKGEKFNEEKEKR